MSRYDIAPGTGWTFADEDDPRIYVAVLPQGPIAVLDDVGALIWHAVANGADDVVTTVAETTGHPVETVRQDVETFVAELVERGLLRRA